ncbi:unnamed protein product [Lupinus luteus]|uniref:Uncharacterized protein n=1 Tax=Lupinus luteus TaxID=3873 RepID=A0AAV1X8L0_LUPLU
MAGEMSFGEKSQRSSNLYRNLHDHDYDERKKQVPKGCLVIKVGTEKEQQRFLVPVVYFNHPLFMKLLKRAEEEYGFDQKGTITIPCHVEEFINVQGLIDREISQHHGRCFGF